MERDDWTGKRDVRIPARGKKRDIEIERKRQLIEASILLFN